jgi:hypothetical protein
MVLPNLVKLLQTFKANIIYWSVFVGTKGNH